MRAGARGLPPCSQASLEGDGALSGGTARRKLLHHHFPYLVCLIEVISGKCDMAERAGALRAHRALGILRWDPAGPAAPRPWGTEPGPEPAPAPARPACKGDTVSGSVSNASRESRL